MGECAEKRLGSQDHASTALVHSPSSHRQGRAGPGRHRPVGEGEGRTGRPRPRLPRPLSREEERAAPRPRDVERSRDDEARSSRTRGGTTGGVCLLGAQDPLSVSRRPAPISTPISSLFSAHTISELSGPSHHQLPDIHALAHDPHRHLTLSHAPAPSRSPRERPRRTRLSLPCILTNPLHRDPSS